MIEKMLPVYIYIFTDSYIYNIFYIVVVVEEINRYSKFSSYIYYILYNYLFLIWNV